MTTLQVRIGQDDKQNAKEIFDSLGLDMSTAIKIFLKTVIRNKGIPFPLITENGFTPEFEQKILEEEKEALESGKTYNSFQEILDEAKKENSI